MAAEGGGEASNSAGDGESVKLFVGQVPKHMTEPQLLALFKEFALVDEVSIIRDKVTKASRGLRFVVVRLRFWCCFLGNCVICSISPEISVAYVFLCVLFFFFGFLQVVVS